MSSKRRANNNRLAVGIDVGSTTVKAVVCDTESFEILWSDYQRHETRQPEMVMDFRAQAAEIHAAQITARFKRVVDASQIWVRTTRRLPIRPSESDPRASQ